MYKVYGLKNLDLVCFCYELGYRVLHTFYGFANLATFLFGSLPA